MDPGNTDVDIGNAICDLNTMAQLAGGPVAKSVAARVAELLRELNDRRHAAERTEATHGTGNRSCREGRNPSLFRPSEIAERLTRLEALFVDPRDLAKLTDEELREAAQMPGGSPLPLGRLSKIEDRLALLELAVTVIVAREPWISVIERLPPHDQPVLARFKPVKPLHDGQPDFEVCVAAYDAEKAKVKSRAKIIPPVREIPRCDWYRYAARGDTCYYFAATHWRELPR